MSLFDHRLLFFFWLEMIFFHATGEAVELAVLVTPWREALVEDQWGSAKDIAWAR